MSGGSSSDVSSTIPAAPTLADVLLARQVVSRYLAPTPVLRPEGLARELGFEVVLKCENMQPIGAFKVRGGIYLMSQLDAESRERGVVSASTGNHAQSIAYAAREFGVRAVIFMPENGNPVKLASTKALGAQVIEFGRDFDECRVEAGNYAEREGMRFIHSANEPHLIAGVGTYALELIEAAPDLDVVIVPVGGGSGVCATALVFKTMRPQTRVIAVQAETMPVVFRSFHERQLLSLEGGSTWAEGLATRVAFELPYEMMQELVDDVQTVSDEEMRQAMLSLLEQARVVAEGAGAASLALARKLAPELRGKRVGLVISGGNVTRDTLQRALSDDGNW